MPNFSYRRGSAFERLLLEKLRAREYDGLRSAGSHSSVDVIAWNAQGTVYVVQCKTTKQENYNLSALIWEDSVRELTNIPGNLIKVLCIKQYRKITTLVWQGIDRGWIEADVFNLNNLRRNKTNNNKQDEE